jgi:hypothetical protein
VHAIHGGLGFGGAVGGSGRRSAGGMAVDLAVDVRFAIDMDMDIYVGCQCASR